MAYLGVPYRLTYIGKNYRRGLTDVIGMVMKPDGSVTGPYALLESTGLGFQGVYTANFDTDSVQDREGEYLLTTISPSENTQSTKQFTMNRRPFIPFGQKIVFIKPAFNSTFVTDDDPNSVSLNQTQISFQSDTQEFEIVPTNPGPNGLEIVPGGGTLHMTLDSEEE